MPLPRTAALPIGLLSGSRHPVRLILILLFCICMEEQRLLFCLQTFILVQQAVLPYHCDLSLHVDFVSPLFCRRTIPTTFVAHSFLSSKSLTVFGKVSGIDVYMS